MKRSDHYPRLSELLGVEIRSIAQLRRSRPDLTKGRRLYSPKDVAKLVKDLESAPEIAPPPELKSAAIIAEIKRRLEEGEARFFGEVGRDFGVSRQYVHQLRKEIK